MLINKVFINLFACFFVGYSLGHFKNNLSSKITKPLIEFGIPLIVAGTLLESGIDKKLFFSINFGIIFVGLQVFIVFLISLSLLKKFNILLSSIIGNTGYIGLPISNLFLEKDYLIYSVGFDIGAMLITWGVLPILFGIKNKTKKIFFDKEFILDTLLNSPAIRGFLLFYVINNFFKHAIILKTIEFSSSVVSFGSLIFVGICLGELAKKYKYSFIYKNFKPILVVYKLILAPIFMKIICRIFYIDDNASRAFIIQSAMPSAISIILLSEFFNHEKKDVAAMVVCTTLLSLLSLPTIKSII